MSQPSTEVQTPLSIALQQFETARKYMLGLVTDLNEDEWYWMPNPPICHIAWQIGHVAVAQYGLMLFRQRGRLSEDAELMPSDFRKLFMKGSIPQSNSQHYPRPDEILAVLNRVNQQALRESAEFSLAALDEPSEPPHAGPPTRLGSLLFAAQHEMLHAGQVGLLRRLMGKATLR